MFSILGIFEYWLFRPYLHSCCYDRFKLVYLYVNKQVWGLLNLYAGYHAFLPVNIHQPADIYTYYQFKIVRCSKCYWLLPRFNPTVLQLN
jgi:hypothetical protein